MNPYPWWDQCFYGTVTGLMTSLALYYTFALIFAVVKMFKAK